MYKTVIIHVEPDGIRGIFKANPADENPSVSGDSF
jgi:hypothetical protein